MFRVFRDAWKDDSLRKKILFTLFIIIIYRIGCVIPVPFLNAQVMADWMNSSGGNTNFLQYFDALSGGAMSKATIFALAIQPYINASIIVQLLTYAIPPLERLSKEGQEGRKTINKITAYTALGISLLMSFFYYKTMKNAGAVIYTDGFDGIFAMIVIIAAFSAGASLVVWLGNELTEKGIGNGISLILFAGIVARGPQEILGLLNLVRTEAGTYAYLIPLTLVLFIAMITFIVLMNEAERRIPVQYAKRVVGRKQYGGQNTHIPIKVIMSGVMPIIFAMSFMSIPTTLTLFITPTNAETFWMKLYRGFISVFRYDSPWYCVIYFILIIAFNYFYVSMQYNPIEIANSLRQNNGGIPGIRPGKPTSDFIQRILSKLTLFGAICLGIIAIIPPLLNMFIPEANLALGGTSILIIVSVALETVRTLESQLMMRHHKGFLE